MKKFVILASVALLLVLFILGGGAAWQHKQRRERAHWEAGALQQLTGISMTNEQILAEIDQIRHPTANLDFGWAHERVILMTNGEYLVYAFWHGANNGSIDHLFLAHGTNGKWYYSSYHFCNRMAAIQGDDPAGSISEFATRYWLREFDGKSDECLKRTDPLK